MTDPSYLETVDRPNEFRFPKKRKIRGIAAANGARKNEPSEIRSVAARQFVHRTTGGLFARLIMDEQKWVILVVILNHKLMREKVSLHGAVTTTVNKLRSFMSSTEIASDGPAADTF
jgi:hypothetical protein